MNSPYIYVSQNPMNLIDPTGMGEEETDNSKKDKNTKSPSLNQKNKSVDVNKSDKNISDDYITVGDDGKATNVVKNNKPNKFFDQNGVQIKVNDPVNDNQFLETQTFNVGDQIFTPALRSVLLKNKFVVCAVRMSLTSHPQS